ncbi:MAG TPA: tail fiber protein [Acidobacteriaceae bacterium]|jgi:microcystin-dependent protein|nr:tail fiber protein [Acidobacteriaceae bacterium]
MSTPYVGEIRMVGFNFAPVDWMLCNGQLLAISEYETLYNLIGTTYGGDGQSTFALPNLQGRIAVHQGSSYVMGELSGTEVESLLLKQIPKHTHTLNAQSAVGHIPGPGGNIWADSSLEQYSTAFPASTMTAALEYTGGGEPHENMPPFQVVNFIISLFGVYPSQS